MCARGSRRPHHQGEYREETGIMTINTVATARGAEWLTGSFSYVMRSAGAWIGVTILIVLFQFVLSLVKTIGWPLSRIAGPVFAGGLMLGCREQDRGGAFRVKYLLSGFNSEHIGQLGLIGVLYLVAFAVIFLMSIMVVVLAAGGAALLHALESGNLTAAATSYPILVLLLVLIALVLMVPLLMAVWFAPALVVLQGQTAVAALGDSFRGCMRNGAPLTVYGLLIIVFGVLASIPLFLGWLIFAPAITVSTYLAYRDIFEQPAVPASFPEQSQPS